jgi:4-hydroxyphenylpyruvate dioxygenase
MTVPGKESLGLRGVASIHVFVRDLQRYRDFYLENLDFSETALSTPRFEQEQRARASVVEAGAVRFVFMEPLGAKGESYQWLQRHPDGVARIAFEVEDVARAFELLRRRGATMVTAIERREVDGGTVRYFDIATAFGDTMFRFLQCSGSIPQLPGLVRTGVAKERGNRFGIQSMDHITTNFLTLKPATMWMEEVLGLEPYWDIAFHTQDLQRGQAGGSGLRSVVMWDPESGIKFANNEPAAPYFSSSQNYQFCTEHRGAGVQHVAFCVDDIVSTVRGMRERGVLFMQTPGAYYDLLPERLLALGVDTIDEDIAALRELEILVDGDGPRRYLLQVFMREAAGLFRDPQAGPLFIELIQRKGNDGFGAGNFRALFESIEREQGP